MKGHVLMCCRRQDATCKGSRDGPGMFKTWLHVLEIYN